MDDADYHPRCLCLDIETGHEAETHLHKIGAWRVDTGQAFYAQRPFEAAEARAGLDRLAVGAAFVLGHNITAHDQFERLRSGKKNGKACQRGKDWQYATPLTAHGKA